jgi:hypothetical protein
VAHAEIPRAEELAAEPPFETFDPAGDGVVDLEQVHDGEVGHGVSWVGLGQPTHPDALRTAVRADPPNGRYGNRGAKYGNPADGGGGGRP